MVKKAFGTCVDFRQLMESCFQQNSCKGCDDDNEILLNCIFFWLWFKFCNQIICFIFDNLHNLCTTLETWLYRKWLFSLINLGKNYKIYSILHFLLRDFYAFLLILMNNNKILVHINALFPKAYAFWELHIYLESFCGNQKCEKFFFEWKSLFHMECYVLLGCTQDILIQIKLIVG